MDVGRGGKRGEKDILQQFLAHSNTAGTVQQNPNLEGLFEVYDFYCQVIEGGGGSDSQVSLVM